VGVPEPRDRGPIDVFEWSAAYAGWPGPHDLTWRRAPALQKLAERSDSTVSATPIHPPPDDNALETSEKASRVGDFEGDANEGELPAKRRLRRGWCVEQRHGFDRFLLADPQVWTNLG
jgi:hypothetical protein